MYFVFGVFLESLFLFSSIKMNKNSIFCLLNIFPNVIESLSSNYEKVWISKTMENERKTIGCLSKIFCTRSKTFSFSFQELNNLSGRYNIQNVSNQTALGNKIFMQFPGNQTSSYSCKYITNDEEKEITVLKHLRIVYVKIISNLMELQVIGL